jgi:dipeptidyl aminopeptidase/acylaminoacyl peptidase
MKKISATLLLIAGFAGGSIAQENLNYQVPHENILKLLDAPNTPFVRINSKADWMLLLESPDYPSIEQVAQPMLRIGGLRINPANNASATATGAINIKLKSIADGKEYTFTGLPEKPRMGNISWSPDEKMIAFTQTTTTGVQLWIADLATKSARRLSDLLLNDAFGTTFRWTADSKGILGQFVPDNRGKAPEAIIIPTGPVVQQNLGKTSPSRTYQDLLKNPYDVALFDYYLTAQLKLVDLAGQATNIGSPALYRNFEYSPDGKYILSQTVQKPYSYLVTVGMFSYKTELLDQSGALQKTLFTAPLADNLPTGFDAVAKGPRSYNWRPDEAATLYWAEAMDEGNPNKDSAVRDAVFTLAAPFDSQSKKIAQTAYRYRGINWATKNMAILNERWWKSRMEKQSIIDPEAGKVVKVVSERSYENTYTDPGDFVYTKNAYNRSVLLLDKGQSKTVYTIGTGASAVGDRPFLLKWNLENNKADTLFKSRAPYYEMPVYFRGAGNLLISRESVEQTPNYYTVDLKNRKMKAITAFQNPYEALEGVKKQQLSYKRGDGLTLTGTLYLPKGYKKEDGPLPMLMWAYPREFKTASAASQIKGSPYRFTRINWGSPIYWVNRGYAILDNADMPIVGEGKSQPNDSFVAQIQDNAKSAINYVASLGVADPKRIAVGGHSYGAFMTANLLAHTNLFAAGIARSGAYNRTLTPFGFQAEERTYWQAPEVYFNMSPFSFADKVKTPILFIHGEADNNSGTFPIQSERFYNALKGHGATTRLVFLPNESHGYAAKESIMHTLWEMDQWLETYVKNKK